VYQFGFCLCGDIAEKRDVTFDLSIRGDNWSEVWLIDESGVQPDQLLLTQTHAVIVDNFKMHPANYAVVVKNLNPGRYSLALLQRNEFYGGASATSLDAIITTSMDGFIKAYQGNNDCDFAPSLTGSVFHGSTVTENNESSTEPGDGPIWPGKNGRATIDSETKEKDEAHQEIKVFPNPSTDLYKVINSGKDNFYYTVTSLTGQVVINRTSSAANSVIIDLSNKPNGVYLLQIDNIGETEIIKLLKQ